MGTEAYLVGLDRNQANFAPLSPLGFLERAAAVYPDRLAVVNGAQRFTWGETYARCRRLASALARRGIGKNDTVAVMCPNTPALYEAHFGVPMCGAVLNALNTRLDAESIAFMLRHGEARALITDREYADTIAAALALLEAPILVIDIDDPEYAGGRDVGSVRYEAFLAEGDLDYDWQMPADEWDAISLSYTSGTTGDPKGVVYHHRGAALNAISNILNWGMPHHAVYLWTLPMFHCNGWCYPWTVAERAGVNVCLRRVEARAAFAAIRDNHVTHMCGAPIVYSMLVNAPAELRAGIDWPIAGQVAGAAPPAAIIEGAEGIGIELTHVYGLTEVYGPATVCAKHEAWAHMPIDRRAERNGRQGVRTPLQAGVTVLDPATMQPVPWDGETMGE
ncbi:AMP-binding protein, partial [Sphingomonas sp.]|uniref:AMP-binding protein n=1 Tax=Sphingomonas sp. TaxID=28214 RepID=UPI0035B0BA42